MAPIPGAYHLVAGTLPLKEATSQDLRKSAERALGGLDPAPTHVMSKLLGPGGGRMERSIRLLCTQVWPVLYQVLTLQEQENDPVGVWCLPKEQAMRRLPRNTALYDTIENFYQALWEYYPSEESIEQALAVIGNGIAFLEAAHSWWTGVSCR